MSDGGGLTGGMTVAAELLAILKAGQRVRPPNTQLTGCPLVLLRRLARLGGLIHEYQQVA
jgi:hypothetical protein